LSSFNYPSIFVIGDASNCQSPPTDALPGIAPVAVQQGKFVGKIICKYQPNDKRPEFHYVDRGMMAVIGK
jgi:NADH dehydrogenase